VGTLAPAFTLPRLEGGTLSLEEYRGQRVLLVFSDPHCGPCDLLSPQLEQLHRRTPDVQVVMISRGEVEANRQKVHHHQLTFPVVLQRTWEVSRLYAMFGTPVGYLIDAAGTIAADVAVGTEPILALLSGTAASSHGQSRKAVPRT
jgi:peroxiredoxin